MASLLYFITQVTLGVDYDCGFARNALTININIDIKIDINIGFIDGDG